MQENGGVWVALAGWLGMIIGARRAGISRWALPLLAYPLALVAIVVLAGEDVARTVGLLVALGARRPRPRDRGAHAAQAGRAAARFSLTKRHTAAR